MFEKNAQSGYFYAVGIGPGSPDLLTIRAVNLIQSADIVVAPRSRLSEESMALQAVAPYLRPQGQRVVEHVYPMERSIEKTMASWTEIALQIQQWLNEGLSVVQVTLGDPLIYSTSHYLMQALRGLGVADDRQVVVPGISAFQATAARLGQSLVIQRGRMTLMSGDDAHEVEEALNHCETLVVYKSGKQLEPLRDVLRSKGLLNQAMLACYVEQEKEWICKDLTQLDTQHMPGYLSTLIVYQGERAWHEAV
jgi:precorrin-2/cobalt-factor-2 C20-methyltransferase